MRRRLIDLTNQRTVQLTAAEAALQANNQADYQSAMEQVRNLNTEIQQVQDLLTEMDRQILAQPGPSGAEARDIAEERGNALMNGDRVQFTANEVRRFLHNQTTIATGTLVQPNGAGSDIRDPLGNVVPSIVDRVRTIDLTGMGSYSEPYVITELEANGGDPATLAGTARAASTDPTFGVAEIKPYELNVTTYVDRNISRMSPANYYQKIYNMAMRAMRRELANLIINGAGDFYGITTAKNKAGANIFAEATLGAIGVNTLDELYFAYGSDEAIGGAARLLLTKPNLKALGALRGTNELQRLFKVTPDTTNLNSGVISDGGVILPYDLATKVGDTKLLYGDPQNFEVGLFGDFSIRVDESIKGVERMTTILGDAFVGGNLVVDKGFVVGTVGAAG